MYADSFSVAPKSLALLSPSVRCFALPRRSYSGLGASAPSRRRPASRRRRRPLRWTSRRRFHAARFVAHRGKLQRHRAGDAYGNDSPGNVLIPGSFLASIANIALPPNVSQSLSQALNTPAATNTGGITGSLYANMSYAGTAGNNQSAQASLHLSGAKMIFTLRWQPLNGDWVRDPAPSQVIVCTRRKVICTSYATFMGVAETVEGNAPPGAGTDGITVTGTMAGLSTTTSAVAPPAASQTVFTPDEPFTALTLPVGNGVAQIAFDVDAPMQLSLINPSVAQYSIRGTASVLMDFCVAGFDLGRFGSHMDGVSGGHTEESTDPSFTRWLPLAFSPTISSQPFRKQAGALPAPWGNIACAYSIAMRREPNPPNPDLDGQSEIYVPSGVYGNFNAPTAPYSPLPGSFVPYYVITDANGDRLVFDRNWHPYDDIHSTVSYLAGTLTLSGAGPPGALKAIGTYTYTFQVSAVDNISASPSPRTSSRSRNRSMCCTAIRRPSNGAAARRS